MNKKALFTAALLLSINSTAVFAADLGKGVRAFENQDYAAAKKELTPLAEEGNADATNLLGQMHENGWGVDQNVEEAKRLYTKGANIGHLDSVNSLRALKNKEYQLELKTVRPAAEAGDAGAMARLGMMNEFGYGLKRNPDLAFSWYSKAAESGLVAAKHHIGRAYNFGTGVAQDFAAAERWYLQAAKQGYTQSLFFLGTLYSNDHGSDKSHDSNVAAYAWMHNAAQLGNDTAQAIEQRLIMKLSESDLASAKSLADKYFQQYVASSTK
ncbi:MAG: tetratricopeptide repeat protein [Pontibacterium sp.]